VSIEHVADAAVREGNRRRRDDDDDDDDDDGAVFKAALLRDSLPAAKCTNCGLYEYFYTFSIKFFNSFGFIFTESKNNNNS